MSQQDSNKQKIAEGLTLERRQLLQAFGVGAVAATTAGLGTVAEAAPKAKPDPKLAAADRSMLSPPCGSEQVLTSADSEGLINVHVKNGKILRVASLDAPENEASPMGLQWHRRVYAPDRILQPMVRVGWKPGGEGNAASRGSDTYKTVSWKTALDLVAGELKRLKEKNGNEAFAAKVVGGWQTAGNLNAKMTQIARFYGLYGGFTTYIGNKSFACWQWAAPYSMGTMYPSDSMRDTLENTKTMIFWSSDPMDCFKVRAVTYGRIQNWLAELKAKGVRFITIDPIQTKTAEMSDLWLPIRPDSDCALMAAMAYVMIKEDLYAKDFLESHTVGFEQFRAYVMGDSDGVPKTPEWASKQTDLPAEQITSLALEYAKTKGVKINCARGIQRNDHGEQQVRMLIALAAMKGEIGLPGGGLGFEVPGFAGVGDDIPQGKAPGAFPSARNPVSQVLLDQNLAEGLMAKDPITFNHDGKTYTYPQPGKSRIKLMHWVGGAMLNQHDDVNKMLKALESVETLIVQDSWWTPGARIADIVLPINTLFEREDITRFWRYVVFQQKIIEPLGQSKSDFWVFKELSDRLGFKDKFTDGIDSEEGWLKKLYGQSDIPMSYEEFKKAGFYKMPVKENRAVAFSAFRQDPVKNKLNTPSGKIEITSERIAKMNYKDCPPTPMFLEPFEWLGSAQAAKYPLAMVNKHSPWRRHSSYDNVAELHAGSKVGGFEAVWINPADAEKRGIKTGDVVRVHNGRGQVAAGAYVTTKVRPRCVVLHQGAWFRPAEPGKIGSLDRGGSSSVLTAQRGTSQLAQGPVCHTCLVEIEKITDKVMPNDYAPVA
jgi:molybdopterin guanine dinucleotide-containing S/N-oxide reductase-like protein